MLVRPGAARQTFPMRRLLSAGPLRVSSRCSVANPQQPLLESRRVLTTAPDSRLWKRKDFRALVGFERNLATAVDEHRFSTDDIPFDGLHAGLKPQSQSNRSGLHLLKPIDPASPLVISEEPAGPKRSRINVHGIPGDLEEMLSIFDACLQVGRLDRAALVLKRFANMDVLAAHEMLELHARWLQARVAQIAAEPEVDKAEDVHKWFELQLRNSRVPINTNIIAYMLKASLLTSQGTRLKRRIERYMSLLPMKAAMRDLYVGKVLTDQDLATIAQVCPAYSIPKGASMRVHALRAAAAAAAGGSGGPGDESGSASTVEHATPEVLGTPQKGMGLATLKSALSLFRELPEGCDIASLPPAQRREIQARLEKDCVDAALARWREENEALMEMGVTPQMSSPTLSSKLYDWHQALEARLFKERERIDASEAAPRKSTEDLDRCMYGPYLYQSPPSRLAAVTILSMLSMLAMHGAEKGVPVSSLVTQLAKFAEEDIRSQQHDIDAAKGKAKTRLQNARDLVKEWGNPMRNPPTVTLPDGTVSTVSDPDSDPSRKDEGEARWPLQIRAKLGALLLSALIETARVTVIREHPVSKELVSQSQPAFQHALQLKRGRKIGMILPNLALVDLMKKEPRGEVLARHLPMVVEPEPWSKFDKGGFIEYPTPLVRLKNHERDQRIYAEAAIERGDMEQMCKGLDVLGKTAWRINRKVFDVMLETWNTGEPFANIPALNPQVPVPPEPDSTEDPMQRRLWLKALKVAENEKSKMHSIRCFMNFQLEVARAFRDQTFYFPHNIDFRGRAYPIPTYLNHMGADHMRGLLLFAKGKPLGESGLRWLKVHLANVYGFDKASLQEREEFATNNIENIFDSAESPLTGKRWWLQAEDPWQCLATCCELKEALQSPDPTAYVSHLPVHQDGTCNGLQHYAALGGDSWGAQQVNLIPGERPADVYSAVAQLVEEEAAKDAATGDEFATAVVGKITRKVVKQTVMTNVYGVTFVGAKKQVAKQLEALYPTLHKETGITTSLLAAYIASKIFVALSTMFRGAHEIQTWLGEIGGRVCRAMTPEQLEKFVETSAHPELAKKKIKGKLEDEVARQFRSTLVWTTPLRMPVVQPYRKVGTRTVNTCLQVLILASSDRDDPVNRRKQLQAFPPNFIHSLDASHMILSALECHEIGLTFAAVHDSFWTHAADVDSMNTVIRDSFIRIHSEDVIGRLKAEFEARYRGSIYLAKIDRDSEVGRRVTELRKRTRLTLKDELLQEKRRQELLRSIDPEEVREGKEMVTPASLFEELATPDMVENEVEPEDLVRMTDDDGADDMSLAGADEGLEFDELDGVSDEASADETSAEDPSAEDASVEEASAEEASAEETPDLEASGKPKKGNTVSDNLATALRNGFAHRLKRLRKSNYFVHETQSKYRVRRTQVHRTSIWLPLTFPDIPEKGDFDVRKLKESKYFFS
ncbi:DNA-directed RNA polymerase, mitochondrial [Madurella mycetomatis]|uniref:DNA-directed RNA polymerase n=1 Tax=Madurella mycetomatis TaxID=100816 RepID=A0A175VP72_9PEZI|nr:DNA-directed RNA polymerase, mitochondrial [Madurella mycetomatis]